jgi:hypothetical protein
MQCLNYRFRMRFRDTIERCAGGAFGAAVALFPVLEGAGRRYGLMNDDCRFLILNWKRNEGETPFRQFKNPKSTIINRQFLVLRALPLLFQQRLDLAREVGGFGARLLDRGFRHACRPCRASSMTPIRSRMTRFVSAFSAYPNIPARDLSAETASLHVNPRGPRSRPGG